MAKYRFRLETLQKLRTAERDRQRARLAEAYRAEDILDGRQAELESQFAALRKWQWAAAAGTHFDVAALQAAARFEPVLKSQRQLLHQQRQLLAAEIERRRQALVEADRGVRALELLDQRRREEHRQNELRAETRQLDEIAGTQRWRQR